MEDIKQVVNVDETGYGGRTSGMESKWQKNKGAERASDSPSEGN